MKQAERRRVARERAVRAVSAVTGIVRVSRLALLGSVVCSFLAAAGCSGKGEEKRAEPSPVAPVTKQREVLPEADQRTQYDLVAAIQAAEKAERGEVARRLRDVQRDFQSKRYRWRVFYVPVTCRSPEQCNVLAFDKAGADRDVVQGWMPRLELTAEAHARLATRCGDKAMCPFEFEGTLTRLVVSADYFTSLTFSDVTLTE